jgi:LPS O-antigen subunit length determinant protein (WzzB/FepE family)
MDIWTILLIVLAVIAIAAVVFALIRKKQRGGSVLAAPGASDRKGGSS